ncbi:sarcosine oxidase subunit gamma [Roseovarius sp. SYSU LYC5161]|uniref:sarcosine oxidase subunit gamma n=1 Tax=Roseovarius halophilus (ex Wu et al. 2025) TaxID=3376060 RepID=UPI002871ED57|nr:sarcosine oxidase subunit gamma [Roseovarius sp.]
MPDYTLTSAPPLAGTDLAVGDTRVTAPADMAIVSVALPLGGEADAEKAVQDAYGAALPEPGKSVVTADGARLVRLTPDQGFVIFTHATPDAERVVADKLKGKVYTTDQTDVWTGLSVDGPMSRAALERICPLDLHRDAFAVDDAHRTVMEHLGVLIIRTGGDAYLLLSASSSAGSFLHAVETSLKNTS